MQVWRRRAVEILETGDYPAVALEPISGAGLEVQEGLTNAGATAVVATQRRYRRAKKEGVILSNHRSPVQGADSLRGASIEVVELLRRRQDAQRLEKRRSFGRETTATDAGTSENLPVSRSFSTHQARQRHPAGNRVRTRSLDLKFLFSSFKTEERKWVAGNENARPPR